MKTFVKWIGSKRKLISELNQYLPEKIENYFEPFAGSASMAFYLMTENRINGLVTLSDTNSDLIAAYKCLTNPKRRTIVLDKLAIHQDKHSSKYFDSVKKSGYDNLEDIAARFLYFNRASFSGIYRVNSQDRYNVSPKTKSDVVWLDNDVYIQAGEFLSKTKIYCTSYNYILDAIKPGDFVFLDPPYHRIFLSGERMYSAKPFTFEDQRKLKLFCDAIDKKGGYFLQTNSAETEMTKLYSYYNIALMDVKYTSHGVDPNVKTNEIIVRNY